MDESLTTLREMRGEERQQLMEPRDCNKLQDKASQQLWVWVENETKWT